MLEEHANAMYIHVSMQASKGSKQQMWHLLAREVFMIVKSSRIEPVELQQLPSQQHALRTHNKLVTAPVTPLHSALLLSLTNDGKVLDPMVLEAAYMR